MQASDATIEWSLLQNQFDSYEKVSLFIKLFAVGVATASVLNTGNNALVLLILGILWLQDGIWKTFQSRIESRLLQLESFFADEQADSSGKQRPFQFNSEYQSGRGGLASLIGEYLGQAIRPTVAFPHAALLVVCALAL